MITVLIWKKVCINLLITYFNIELKRTKLTSHTDFSYFLRKSQFLLPKHQQIFPRWTPTFSKRQLVDSWVEAMSWGSREAWYRVILVLSRYLPWADIAVALPVFTYGKNWRYYLKICDKWIHRPVKSILISDFVLGQYTLTGRWIHVLTSLKAIIV